jgi:hypothetical protein
MFSIPQRSEEQPRLKRSTIWGNIKGRTMNTLSIQKKSDKSKQQIMQIIGKEKYDLNQVAIDGIFNSIYTLSTQTNLNRTQRSEFIANLKANYDAFIRDLEIKGMNNDSILQVKSIIQTYLRNKFPRGVPSNIQLNTNSSHNTYRKTPVYVSNRTSRNTPSEMHAPTIISKPLLTPEIVYEQILGIPDIQNKNIEDEIFIEEAKPLLEPEFNLGSDPNSVMRAGIELWRQRTSQTGQGKKRKTTKKKSTKKKSTKKKSTKKKSTRK